MRFIPAAKFMVLIVVIHLLTSIGNKTHAQQWIRVNQLGYTCKGIKVAVWASKEQELPASFQLLEEGTNRIIYTAKTGNGFGAYGPFTQTLRLKFTDFYKTG